MHGVGWKTGRLFAVLACGLALSACMRQFAPGPGMSSYDLARINGSCRLTARHGGSDFSARGDYRFVAAASLGHAIGEGIRFGEDYNDCMRASGAIEVDPKAVVVAQQVPVAVPAVAQAANVGTSGVASGVPSPQPEATVAAAGAPIVLRPPAVVMPAIYRPETPLLSPVAQRSVDGAASWLRAEQVMRRNDARSRDLYLVLCGAGDQSACIMGAALRR